MGMVSRTKVLAIVMAAALAGCTSPYGPKGPTGGYGELKLGPDTYRVSFDGNGNTSEEQVVDFWLYRCAELTIQNGYSYFGLAPEGQSLRDEGAPGVKRLAAHDPGAEAPRMLQVKGGGGGGYVYVPSYSTTTVRTWHKQATIVMYRSRPGATTSPQSYALHAQTVINALREYVQSGAKAKAPPRKEVIEAAMRYAPDHPAPGVQQGASSLDDLSDLLNAPK